MRAFAKRPFAAWWVRAGWTPGRGQCPGRGRSRDPASNLYRDRSVKGWYPFVGARVTALLGMLLAFQAQVARVPPAPSSASSATSIQATRVDSAPVLDGSDA